MVHGSVISQEGIQYSSMARDIEMTLFAVSKSEYRSRLISWPRVQNEAIPQPPYTSLPNPSLFEAIRSRGKAPGAFYLDISNMLHNITLPLWLARLLPMQPIMLSNLPPNTQRRIVKRISIPAGQKTVLVRPCQATMPMGFKWAIFIAHTFVSSCFDESFRLLKASRLAFSDITLSKLRAKDAPFVITQRSPLLLHIIDDAAFITVDWLTSLVTIWYRLIRTILPSNLLPVAEGKSSHPSQVSYDSVSFIGCNWNLQEGVVYPAPEKLTRALKMVNSLLGARTCEPKNWERLTGKLLWMAMLNRPLLACLRSIFSESSVSEAKPSPPRSAASKRELRTLAALLPLACVDLNVPIAPIIVAFDASLIESAVIYSHASQHLLEKLWTAAQTVRFSPSESNSQLPEVRELIKACPWKLAFIHYWRKNGHINCLEAATAVLSAEWLTRCRMSSCRVILLTDSLVTMGALQKGRSSKTGILLRCRRFATLTLAHELRVTLSYVTSGLNPADQYTRIPKKCL